MLALLVALCLVGSGFSQDPPPLSPSNDPGTPTSPAPISDPPPPPPPPPSPPPPSPPPEWRTLDHSPGRCAFSGVCGHRADGDPLPCAVNAEAAPPGPALSARLAAVCPALWAEGGGEGGRYCCSEQQVDRIAADTSRALPFIVGCPACRRNFVALWCTLTCSPDQAAWANVTAVQAAADTGATHAVAEVDYWLADEYGDQLYDSCKDVKFGAANVPAMSFIGGGARSGAEWLAFLGTLKDKRFPPIGSPIQLNFRPENSTPPGLSPMRSRVVGCGENGFRCSCGDCPAAPGCQQPAPEPPAPDSRRCHVGSLPCLAFTLLWVYAALAAATLAGFILRPDDKRSEGKEEEEEAEAEEEGDEGDGEAAGGARGGFKRLVSWGLIWSGWSRVPAGRGRSREGESGGGGGGAGGGGNGPLREPLLAGGGGGGGGGGGDNGGGGGECGPPFVERLLQRWYFKLGLFVGHNPVTVVAVGTALVCLCCVGLVWFRVETDPQRLWVGPTSQAAREKAAYEASFGPFYRVEQLILATRPTLQQQQQQRGEQQRGQLQQRGAAGGPLASPAPPAGPPPPIVTPESIRLLFHMQQLVEELEAPLPPPPGSPPGTPPALVRLSDVCYKPFGDACATQSVLQYWRLNASLYEAEQARPAGAAGRMTPEYCFNHWFTECRSAFQAPIDPHVVLGGFPQGPDFTTYSAGATSFVTTYPLSSHPATRPAALAWEAALLELARTQLEPLARAANLSLSYSAERSVQDELTRESRADAGTVAASYALMLAYIAAALGSFPPPGSVRAAALGRRSRAAGGAAGDGGGGGDGGGALGVVAGWWRRVASCAAAAWCLALRAGLTSRASLGLGGVAIVAASVAGALGLVSAAGLWCTLIIMEVIPFLVLAVGVDNMFVLAHAMAKQDHALPPATRLAASLSSAGPSITLAACCEVAAFSLGGLLTGMPAVRNFSLAAAAAVALDFVLQVSVFAALLVLDVRRLAARRLDCAPCVKLGGRGWAQRATGAAGAGAGAGAGGRAGAKAAAASEADGGSTVADGPYTPPLGAALHMEYDMCKDDEPPCIGPCGEGEVDERPYWSLQRVLQAYFERVHAPLLSRPAAQCCVLLLFAASLCASLGALPALQVGLDQAVALPRDSYLQPYYRDLMSQLRVGPPLLFVVRDLDLDPEARQVERICGVAGCDTDSLVNRVAAAARQPRRSFISAPAASWLDDFMTWLNPDLPACCRAQPSGGGGGAYCPPPDQPPCAANASACAACRTCVQAAFEGGRPSVAQFQAYLPWFLSARPSESCAKGGVGAFSDSLQRADPTDPTTVAGLAPGPGPAAGGGDKGGRVAASSFRTYYPPLNSQADFIEALRKGREFAAAASRELRLDVYAYSLFHVFFEQYLDVGSDALRMLGLPLGAVGGCCWLLAGRRGWRGAALLGAVLASLLAHLGGAMVVAGIQVNAVSLVNLAMALGIAVEFGAHVLHAFMAAPDPDPDPASDPGPSPPLDPSPHPDETPPFTGAGGAAAPRVRRLSPYARRCARAAAALRGVGASVLSGVTLTKVVGVAVLAAARTQIFEVYYFRLYAALVAAGAAHGLVLLPVLLALAGPGPWGRGGGRGRGRVGGGDGDGPGA